MPVSRPSGGLSSSAVLLARLTQNGVWRARDIRSNNTRQQCRRIARLFRQKSALLPPGLCDSVARLLNTVAERTSLLTDFHPDEWDAATVCARLAAYRSLWLREPESWFPDLSLPFARQWRGLVRHLLAAWPLPDYFENAWLVWGPLTHLERDWYCQAARGGSLRAAPGMPRSVSSRALHLAMNLRSESLTLRSAVRSGQLMACHASAPLVEEVLASRIAGQFSDDHLWLGLIRKTAQSRGLEPGTFSLVADTLLEFARRGNLRHAANLLRLPLDSLRRHCLRWWRQVADYAVAAGWPGGAPDICRPTCRAELSGLVCSGWPSMEGVSSAALPAEAHTDGMIWSFHELTTHLELVLEGHHLRHCVATYREKCLAGDTSIFSLRWQDPADLSRGSIRQLTLEIDRRDRRIVQIRGRWNRLPHLWERGLISTWAGRNQLGMAA